MTRISLVKLPSDESHVASLITPLYSDVIMKSSASLAIVRGIQWWPVNYPHKGPVTRKMLMMSSCNIVTLVPVIAWGRQATSHYLDQGWPRTMSPYGFTRPQVVNVDVLLGRSVLGASQVTSPQSRGPTRAESSSVTTAPDTDQAWTSYSRALPEV